MSRILEVLTEENRRRFEARLVRDEATGCLLWQGGCTKGGYGSFWVGSRTTGTAIPVRTHRLAWELANGPIPDGLDVLHECDTPRCVEASHLFLGTDVDNARDKAIKGRGPKSRAGLSFGAFQRSPGRYTSHAWINGRLRSFGTFDSWQEASAVALYQKNLALYPDLAIN